MSSWLGRPDGDGSNDGVDQQLLEMASGQIEVAQWSAARQNRERMTHQPAETLRL